MTTANRRQMLAGTGLASLAAALPVTTAAAAQAPVAGKPNLFVGTGGHGHTYPGPSLPFGMVQLGPDTDNSRWDACSGYHQDDGSIMGFSHTHLSGTGIGGPHIGLDMIWPMSIITHAMNSDDDAVIRQCLAWLKTTHGGTGFMHESFHRDDPGKFTRSWFAWANGLFGELILDLERRKPALLAARY